MHSRIINHVRGNIVGYVALFAALGGTSYAAVSLAPGSVTSRALANGAVTHAKLGASSVWGNDLRTHSLTAADFKAGALAQALNGRTGSAGRNGTNGPAGPRGPAGPAGHDGSASIAATARFAGPVTAPSSSSTNVPLSGGSWTQAANSVNLITGSMTLGIPATCTGSLGNELVINVDGTPETFGEAPMAPAGGTETVPFAVSELMEPGTNTKHTVTAQLANTCTKSGESYTVSNVKLDVLNFN
jgi:hypothetical protein